MFNPETILVCGSSFEREGVEGNGGKDSREALTHALDIYTLTIN